MYMSLEDLRTKFAKDQAFAVQFVNDAADVGINVDILDATGAWVDASFDDKGNLIGGKLYDDVNLLNTYVRVVKKITLTDGAIGKARLYDYLHAPFNEPDFIIDTNSRTISVPSEFNKNGVAVVGDHLAEILFFTIPRFYDVVDLLESTNINIYWTNSGIKNADGTLQPEVTTPVVKYAVGDTLYLGWAISEHATAAAGTIEFIFEFEHVNDSGLVDFRLETQPAKVVVKNTLIIDKNNVERDSYNDIVYSRAIYSPVINSLTSAPAQILTNLIEGQLDFDNDEDDDSASTTLTVNAISPDNGHLVYNWCWNSIMVDQPEGDLINDDSLPHVVTYVLDNEKNIQFSDPVDVENLIDVYEEVEVEETDNPAEMGLYVASDSNYVLTEDTEPQENTQYYRLTQTGTALPNTTYRTLKTNVPGVYQVYIGNENDQGGIRYVYSATTIIDPASPITITNTLPRIAYLDTDTSNMSVEVAGANGAVSYQWYKEDIITHDQTKITGATESSYDPSNNNVNTTQTELRGLYYCVAKNIKNNTVTTVTSTSVEINPVPTKLPTTSIGLTRDAENGNIFHLSVTPRYVNEAFKVYGQVTIYTPSTSGTKTTIKPIPNLEGFFSTTTLDIDISTITELYDGLTFDINVFVVPVCHPGEPNYERFAMEVITVGNQTVLSPAETGIQLKDLIK